MPLISVSFHQSRPKFWWYAFYRQHKPPSSPEQRIFPLISSLQQFDKSFVSRHFCYGVSDVNSFLRQYRLNSPTLLWDYSHIVPLNQIEVTPETWSSIVYNLVVSGAIGVIHKIFTTLSMWLTVFSPRTVTFSLGNIRTHRMQVETIFGGPHCRCSLTLHVSPSRAPVLSFTHYFQAPVTRAILIYAAINNKDLEKLPSQLY